MKLQQSCSASLALAEWNSRVIVPWRLVVVALAAFVIGGCEAVYAPSNSAIRTELLNETPAGTPRQEVGLWLHNRRIPCTRLDLAESPLTPPASATQLEVGEMNNDGKLLSRDVDVFYFFDRDGRLVNVSVRSASPTFSWADAHYDPCIERDGGSSWQTVPITE